MGQALDRSWVRVLYSIVGPIWFSRRFRQRRRRHPDDDMISITFCG